MAFFFLFFIVLRAAISTLFISRSGPFCSPEKTRGEAAHHNSRGKGGVGLSSVCLVGVSQGGMISQWLAIDHPDKVDKLVLTVTLSRPNETIKDVISRWKKMAERGDYRGIMLDTAERSYSEKRLKKTRLEYKLLGSIGKPKSFERFIIQAESCMTHNAYDLLHQIQCPTLVIGGKEDKIVTGKASEEIAGRISNCQIYMYEGLGHGLYEEASDFLPRVKAFCV